MLGPHEIFILIVNFPKEKLLNWQVYWICLIHYTWPHNQIVKFGLSIHWDLTPVNLSMITSSHNPMNTNPLWPRLFGKLKFRWRSRFFLLLLTRSSTPIICSKFGTPSVLYPQISVYCVSVVVRTIPICSYIAQLHGQCGLISWKSFASIGWNPYSGVFCEFMLTGASCEEGGNPTMAMGHFCRTLVYMACEKQQDLQ